MNGVKISKRLEKVAQCVSRGNRVADIGCDHAYTAIYLVEQAIASRVIALDINKGPLQKANKNIEEYECTKYIETRLSDGAKMLKKDEVDTILISGMGGRLTNKILADSIEIVRGCSQLVLQPQSEIHLVREYLQEIGYVITYEDMLIDDGKYYVIINAINEYHKDSKTSIYEHNNEIREIESITKNLHDRYGRYLLENRNEILRQYLLKEVSKSNDITDALNKRLEELSDKNCEENNKDFDRITTRIKELEYEQILISEALKYYE